MLKTFSIGGVHPHENKLSAHQPIIKAEIPAKPSFKLRDCSSRFAMGFRPHGGAAPT